MNEIMKDDIKYIFYVDTKKYQGYIKAKTTTHIIIYDTYINKTYHLPINKTVIEEIDQ